MSEPLVKLKKTVGFGEDLDFSGGLHEESCTPGATRLIRVDDRRVVALGKRATRSTPSERESPRAVIRLAEKEDVTQPVRPEGSACSVPALVSQ